MNIYRGLLRIWIVYAVVVLIVGVVTHQDRLTFREFNPPQYVQDKNLNALVTVVCAARVPMATRCRTCSDSSATAQYQGVQAGCAQGSCMEPDYAQADQEAARLFELVGIQDVNPIVCQGINEADLIRWSPTKIGILLLIALAPLLLGLIIAWIRRGFRQ